ncbi:MAG: hypothetical protein MUF59_02725 [Candidatus Krumholzibacteria bacterium]|jgi:hypothetical protein|nr:hypothetical protein [Candidatus Krumholzibacteria bacterium]
MTMIRITGILALLMATGRPAWAENGELARLAREDQSVRAGSEDLSSDDERRRRVLELLAEGLVVTPTDKFNAGLVLQHTGLVFCGEDLKSQSVENYLLAHFLFKQALAGGMKEAAYLAAASIDRYLSFALGFQMYGTNRIIDPVTGKEYLVPIDRAVTDEERALYGVPALRELLQKWPEQPKTARPDSVGG